MEKKKPHPVFTESWHLHLFTEFLGQSYEVK